MNIQRVKQGARITYFNGIYMIAIGIFYIIFRDYIMKENFISINQLWGFFNKFNSEIASLFSIYNILTGILLISIGIIIIFSKISTYFSGWHSFF